MSERVVRHRMSLIRRSRCKLKLFFQAGLVWGCWPNWSLPLNEQVRDYERQVRARTPLWPDLMEMEMEQRKARAAA